MVDFIPPSAFRLPPSNPFSLRSTSTSHHMWTWLIILNYLAQDYVAGTKFLSWSSTSKDCFVQSLRRACAETVNCRDLTSVASATSISGPIALYERFLGTTLRTGSTSNPAWYYMVRPYVNVTQVRGFSHALVVQFNASKHMWLIN